MLSADGDRLLFAVLLGEIVSIDPVGHHRLLMLLMVLLLQFLLLLAVLPDDGKQGEANDIEGIDENGDTAAMRVDALR